MIDRRLYNTAWLWSSWFNGIMPTRDWLSIKCVEAAAQTLRIIGKKFHLKLLLLPTMKRIIILSLFTLFLSCEGKYDPTPLTKIDKKCNILNGNQLYLGSQGGCYYLDGHKQVYVNQSDCNC